MLHEAARAGDHRAKAIFASALITGEYGVALDVDRGLVDLEELIATKEIAAGPVVSILEMRIGQAEANWRLGRLLYEGKYLPGDKRRGRELIEKSAAKGNRDAARWLARLAIGNDTP
jgi:TPR repeat protein